MAKEYFIEIDGKRTVAKAFDHLPNVGDTVMVTLYGKLRATRHVVRRIEWAIAQEESPAYFNRPKQVVIHLDADGGADEGEAS